MSGGPEWFRAWQQRQAEHESPAQTPVTRDAKLLPVDWRLLGRLAGYGPYGIWPGVPDLAIELGISDRTVQRSLRRLEAAGLVEREATFQRPDDGNWTPRRRGIEHFGQQDTNTYRVLDPGDTNFDRVSRESPAQTPVTRPESDMARVTPRTGKAPADGGYQGNEDEDEFALVPPGPVEVAIEPPAALQLDHEPTRRDLDATLEAFGTVEVLSVRPNDGPAAAYRTARGRLIDLERAGGDDFRRAVDQLDRDTCLDGGCRPGDPCRRHTRRRRS